MEGKAKDWTLHTASHWGNKSQLALGNHLAITWFLAYSSIYPLHIEQYQDF
jgi:hypothetical protein